VSEGNLTWVLTTGEAGMRSQALGLAEAVGLPVEEKRIAVRRPWSWLPGGLLPIPLSALGPEGDRLAPPWPLVVVGCGRRSIGIALSVKRLSGGRTIAAYVQNPEWGRRDFDVVAALPHDNVQGSNVVTAPTALHGVTPQKLATAREEWRNLLAPDGQPVLGVLIGGDNGGYRLTAPITNRLISIMKAAHADRGMRSVITPSRRTAEATRRAIAGALATDAFGWLWDETGANPYLGILGAADRLIVTGESISMISEALATGRPVHVLPLEGQGRRHDAFLTRIISERLVSPIEGDDLDWNFQSPGPIASTAEPARRIRELLAIRQR
jgi:mitochondrial fission protein ELM1